MSEQHRRGDWILYMRRQKGAEVIDFGTNKKEAIRFGEGSWK